MIPALRVATVCLIFCAGCKTWGPQFKPVEHPARFATTSHMVDLLGNIDASQPYCQTEDEAFPATKLNNGSYVCFDPHIAKQHFLKEQP